MDLGWQIDNPAITLGKYYEDSKAYAEKKAAYVAKLNITPRLDINPDRRVLE
jgi:hypothetical protein